MFIKKYYQYKHIWVNEAIVHVNSEFIKNNKNKLIKITLISN